MKAQEKKRNEDENLNKDKSTKKMPGKKDNRSEKDERNKERDYPSREPEGAPYIGDNPDEIRRRTPNTEG